MSIEKVLVKIDGRERDIEIGTSLEDLADSMPKSKNRYIGARVNGVISELHNRIYKSCEVEFVDILDKEGNRMYMRSLCFVYLRAVRELFGKTRVTIEHSVGGALYTEIHTSITEDDIISLEKRMQEIIEENSAFVGRTVSREEAIELFKEDGQNDKVRLLKYRPFDYFRLYKNGEIEDYLYGLMAPSTGYVSEFKLFSYYPGIIIYYPRSGIEYHPERFNRKHKLSYVYREAKRWASILNCENVCDLNEMIQKEKIGDFIRVNEALHEKKIIEIASQICESSTAKRLVLIAGPSSSGKTTFAQRLMVHLRVLGKRPVAISLDNYYKNNYEIERDENGEQDLENINAIDVKLFNEQLSMLFEGEEVEIPRYDFTTGRRTKGELLKIDDDQIIIVEGIHGLNPDLTLSIEKDIKFKIYISALTQLNIDDHNRIPSTDCRLLRRLVRDYKYRAASGEKTLSMWQSVRAGEEKFIFPFQEESDAIFNSTLVYEIAILKNMALPIINDVSEKSEYYYEATRLRKFLNYFSSFNDVCDIPNNSIMREFIGGSCFFN